MGELVTVALATLARDGLFPATPKPAFLQTAHVSQMEA